LSAVNRSAFGTPAGRARDDLLDVSADPGRDAGVDDERALLTDNQAVVVLRHLIGHEGVHAVAELLRDQRQAVGAQVGRDEPGRALADLRHDG
jgi:hypothetical protein